MSVISKLLLRAPHPPAGASSRSRLLRWVPPAVVLSALAACGDDARIVVAESGAGNEPLYVVSANVFGADATTGYLVTLPSLAANEVPDYEAAVEIPGGAYVYGRNGEGRFYTGSAESPTITRWDLTSKGLMASGQVSFANYGLSSAATNPGNVQILADDKAYFYDHASRQIVIWDPQAMAVRGAIGLDIADRGGLTVLPSEGLVVRGNQVLVGSYWADDGYVEFGETSQLIAIDMTTDSVTSVDHSDGCREIYSTNLADDGTAYFGPSPDTAATHGVLGAAFGTAPCLLRVVPAGVSFDDGYDLDLSIYTGGRPVGQFLLLSDEVAVFRAFYGDELGATAANWPETKLLPAFRWWRWSVGTEIAEELPGQELSLGGGYVFREPGHTYVTYSAADYSSTTLTELDENGEIVPGVTVQGYPYGIVRVR